MPASLIYSDIRLWSPSSSRTIWFSLKIYPNIQWLIIIFLHHSGPFPATFALASNICSAKSCTSRPGAGRTNGLGSASWLPEGVQPSWHGDGIRKKNESCMIYDGIPSMATSPSWLILIHFRYLAPKKWSKFQLVTSILTWIAPSKMKWLTQKNSYLGIVYKIICSHINIYTLLGLSLPICISWYSPNFGIDHLYPIVSL